jgi:hypothetical protein
VADARRSADDLDRLRRGILVRAARTSSHERAAADSAFEALAQRVDRGATAQGGPVMAERFAAEFGAADGSSDVIGIADPAWGARVIARTLAASVPGVAAADLVRLRGEGTSWGRIAAGLGLDLRSAVEAVTIEVEVADGAARATGHVAAIHAAAGAGALGFFSGSAPADTGIAMPRGSGR